MYVNSDKAIWPFPTQNLTSETYESIFRHLVGLLGREINPTQVYTGQHNTKKKKTRAHIHASSGIRTHDPSVRAVEDRTCLRPRGKFKMNRNEHDKHGMLCARSIFEKFWNI
jgi:hypothetical protein